MSGTWLYLAALLVVLAVNAGAVYAAWWALFKDRSRGRRRCPRCWHDLSHSPALTCGECGYTARVERQLFRTRRRWAVAALAIALCVALAGWLYWVLVDRPWTTFLPARVLIAMTPVSGSGPGSPVDVVVRRAAQNTLTDGEWLALVKRAARGDPWARPAGARWRGKYGPALQVIRYQMGNNNAAAWRDPAHAILETIPPRLEITSRPRWPIDGEARFRLLVHEWWPPGSHCRITVRPLVRGAATVAYLRSGRLFAPTSHFFPVGGLDPDARSVSFEVRVERAAGVPPKTRRPRRTSSITPGSSCTRPR